MYYSADAVRATGDIDGVVHHWLRAVVYAGRGDSVQNFAAVSVAIDVLEIVRHLLDLLSEHHTSILEAKPAFSVDHYVAIDFIFPRELERDAVSRRLHDQGGVPHAASHLLIVHHDAPNAADGVVVQVDDMGSAAYRVLPRTSQLTIQDADAHCFSVKVRTHTKSEIYLKTEYMSSLRLLESACR